jgi:hypothetical protein
MKDKIFIFIIFIKFNQNFATKIINDTIFYDNNNNNKNETLINYLNWPVVLLFIFPIFGTIGNYLVCYAIIRDQSLQSKTNFYLFSLAISDLAVSLMVVPLAILKDFLGKYKTWILRFIIKIYKLKLRQMDIQFINLYFMVIFRRASMHNINISFSNCFNLTFYSYTISFKK